MKTFLFVCGGTGGHINPALAVANEIRTRHKNIKIVFAGNPKGMEAKLVPQAGYEFLPFRAMGIQRKINWTNICRNTQSVALLVTASSRAKKLINSVKPDVVFGTGGYVTAPILVQASRMKIKTATHEQNALPGVTTKILAKRVDVLMVAFEKAAQRLGLVESAIITGNPVRQEIVAVDRSKARAKLGIAEDEFCVLSFGGSLGAGRVNQAIAELIATYGDDSKIHHIHATGSVDKENFAKNMDSLGIAYKNSTQLDIREYINDMGDCIAAADIVICRAGASTLGELQAVGKASILIPSPNVAENHQYHNAMDLVNKGAARILEEKNLTGKTLSAMVAELRKNPATVAGIGANAKKMAKPFSVEMIAQEVLKLADIKAKNSIS